MISWILILLAIAAVAGLLGMSRLEGAALTGAKWLAIIVVILFLLVLFGLIGLADGATTSADEVAPAAATTTAP